MKYPQLFMLLRDAILQFSSGQIKRLKIHPIDAAEFEYSWEIGEIRISTEVSQVPSEQGASFCGVPIYKDAGVPLGMAVLVAADGRTLGKVLSKRYYLMTKAYLESRECEKWL